MAAILQCDQCSKTINESRPALHVERLFVRLMHEPGEYDFCDEACLAIWAANKIGVPGTPVPTPDRVVRK